MRRSIRWDLAISDDNLSFPEAASTFACALDVPVSDEETPFLYQILRRTIVDVGLSTYPAKFAYKVHRPFMVNEEPLCVPDQREHLEKNWSYPSGHTAIGWAWALILTEIAPERANEILARGLAFGESRAICNLHWYSDIMWGRVMAAAVVARLQADPLFRHDMEHARAEIAAVREKGLKPTIDCAAEAKALSIKP